VIYRLPFQAVGGGTLGAFGRDAKRLDGELGMTAVLHTWDQNLSQHVHLHCLVPVGARSASGAWHASRSNYLFPVRALSRHYRGRMIALLREAALSGALLRLSGPDEVERVLAGLYQHDWVVYTRHCLKHTDTVVRYLARYTHRSAIHNGRILAIDAASVTLRYQDYRANGKRRNLTLPGEEFVRRLLLHVLPKGLMLIRHFGLLANRGRTAKLAQVRAALAAERTKPPAVAPEATAPGYPCPECESGYLFVISELQPRSQREEAEPRRQR